MFSTSPDDFWVEYQNWQDDLEGKYISALGPRNKHLSNSVLATASSNSDMLNALPFAERKRMIETFRTSILGLNTGYMDPFFQEVGLGGNDVMVGRFSPTSAVADHPLARLLSRMSIQRDPVADAAHDQANKYRITGSIPRAQHMRAQAGPLNIKAGSRITVLDTETLGLATNAGNVREISAIDMVHSGTNFRLDSGSLYTEHLKVGRAAMGSIYDSDRGVSVRMDDYIARNLAGGAARANPLEGQAFIDAVTPVLRRMKESNYIAGHNISFDIAQTLGNVMKTSQYLNDTSKGGIRDLVDDVLIKQRNGQIIDTKDLVSDYFDSRGQQLPLAMEFGKLKSPRSLSLENIMLETNLADLMRADKDLGPAFINQIISGGQHQAEVDTKITAKLLDYVLGNKLEVQRLGSSGALEDLILRKKTLTSYAPTPVSNIADISDIHPDHFRRIYNEARAGSPDVFNVINLRTGKHENIATRTADEWYGYLTDSQTLDHYGSVKFTLMEQHILETRKILDSSGDVSSVIDNLGQWNRFSGYSETGGGFLNRNQTLFKRGELPSDQAFSEFQRRMAKTGMPFAGIGYEERIITSALSSAARGKSTIRSTFEGTAEGRLIDVGDDLGISRFTLRDDFYTKGSIASIPLDVIKRAEADYVLGTRFNDDALQMISFSTVESSKNINAIVDLQDQDEATRFVHWLEDMYSGSDPANADTKELLRKRGLTESRIGDLRTMLHEGTLLERGLNIGHLDGEAGTASFDSVKDLLQNLTRDKDKVKLRAGYLNSSDEAWEEGKGVLRTGAVILDRDLTDDEVSSYLDDLKLAEKRAKQAMDELPNTMSGYKSRIGYKGRDDLVKRADQIYGGIKTKGSIIAGGAALVFGGYYAYKKQRQQNVYDESIQQMGHERSSDYDKYRGEMGMSPAPAVRRMDPLLTAGVVGNLHRDAIGHTSMNKNKHMDLFAGV